LQTTWNNFSEADRWFVSFSVLTASLLVVSRTGDFTGRSSLWVEPCKSLPRHLASILGVWHQRCCTSVLLYRE
jgi:hypothetical protein